MGHRQTIHAIQWLNRTTLSGSGCTLTYVLLILANGNTIHIKKKTYQITLKTTCNMIGRVTYILSWYPASEV